jgi:hypothetical protein
MKSLTYYFIILLAIMLSCVQEKSDSNNHLSTNIFEYTDNLEPRWSSFENITAEKGKGGIENFGAKGHPCDQIPAGKSKTLLEIDGPGIINRMWITIVDRSPKMLRSLKLEMFWDNEEKPAVAVPFGDFFGIGLGKTAKYKNVLFVNPEGRSFNCFISMPFKKHAKIKITNDSDQDLKMIFFDVNFQLLKSWNENYLYFHSFWQRDTSTTLGEDFEILPKKSGKGRFVGTNIGVNANPIYKNYWWGEGEVKIYLNGDQEYPTLVGTGTEDYIGTAWGQGEYYNDYTGCLIADSENRQWAFYRYHIPDPIYFKTDCRVAIQQIGGSSKENVIQLLKEGVDLLPITIHEVPNLHHIYKKGSVIDLENPELPTGWTNFYRSDDVSATSYFYLDKPINNLPKLQPVKIRTYNLN